MKSKSTRGLICMDGRFGLVYHVCVITYRIWEDGSFEYSFEPNYQVIDLLEAPDFQGIPGLDLSLRKKRYIRRNRTPVFIEERSPAPNREDLWTLLEEVGMDHLNRLEWLIRTDMRYGGDNLYVCRFRKLEAPQEACESHLISEAQNTEQAMKSVLRALARGDSLALASEDPACPSTRKALHDTLLLLLGKGEEYRRRLRNGRDAEKRGRRRIVVEDTRLDEALHDMANGRISADEAAERLGISRSTFFRRKREWEG